MVVSMGLVNVFSEAEAWLHNVRSIGSSKPRGVVWPHPPWMQGGGGVTS